MATKFLKTIIKQAAKKATPKPKKAKPTFKSEVNALKAKAMTDAARKAEANKIAKKYGKSVDAVLRPKAALKAIKNRVQRNNKAK